jgi:fatty-acyl-CoA synthase
MMGAVLQTVNWRLSVDQLGYTLNHAQAKLIIIHADFLPVLETVWDKLNRLQAVVSTCH